jgi:hypothetical protein
MSSETTRGKWQVISGSWLKLLAMATMLVDHLAAFYLCNDSRFLEPLFMIGHKYVSVYALLRIMGRLSFPIFAFLVVEGFLHTHDRRKYGRNLFLLTSSLFRAR